MGTVLLNEPKKGKCYMWTSSQPFVLPVQITNFENATVANKAKEIQANSKLLSSIIEEIEEEFKSPIFKSILGKYLEIEKVQVGAPISAKTIALFRKLESKEIEYLRVHRALQKGPLDGKEFAITFKYYNELGMLSS